jgi:anti-sigma B factor antagonist
MTAELSHLTIPRGGLPDVAWLRSPRLSFEVRLVRATQHLTVVVLRGEIDAHTAPHVRDAVGEAFGEGARAIVIDLSEASFIDAAGLGVIVMAARHLGPGGVALVCSHRGIVRVFRICGLDRLLDIYETREQALHGLPT